MISRSRGRRSLHRRAAPSSVALAALVIVIGGLAVACGSGSFDPTGPCTADGRAAGAYPDLEAEVVTTFDARPPDTVDSGRNCSAAALGTLKEGGIDEMRFAGATWKLGRSSGMTIAVLEADGLDAEQAAAFYEAGARAGRNVESVEVNPIRIGAEEGTRIDALNKESFQTVVVAPRGTNRVTVVLVASFIREVNTREAHDGVVTDAIAAAFGEPLG